MAYTNVTYLHVGGKRRSKFHCSHYRKDGSCAYITKCMGSSMCRFYEEEKNVTIEKSHEKTNFPNCELL